MPPRPSPPSFRFSPLLPTPNETLLLILYPLTLLLGSLFSLLNPTLRSSLPRYNPTTHTHHPPLPSYFASKHNILNLFFVKIAWFWISLAFFLFLFPTAVLTPRRVQGFLRWAGVTAWWWGVTRWPGVIDGLFVATGGGCEGVDGVGSGAVCKARGGTWRGGHDASGHVFLLVLGSAFLIMEGWYARGAEREDERLVRVRAGGEAVVKRAQGERVGERLEERGGGSTLGWKGILVIGGLSWWMLLMTAAYFHTWVEKCTGLVLAAVGIWVVYYLPRGVPAVRDVVGMPGL